MDSIGLCVCLMFNVIFQVTENGKQERHLVVTVGKFSVIWDFQRVKNSAHDCYRNQHGLKSCYCYKIVLKDESIVESRFMHENYAVSDSPEAPLVVATPMKVSSISLSGKRSRGWNWTVLVYFFSICTVHFCYLQFNLLHFPHLLVDRGFYLNLVWIFHLVFLPLPCE